MLLAVIIVDGDDHWPLTRRAADILQTKEIIFPCHAKHVGVDGIRSTNPKLYTYHLRSDKPDGFDEEALGWWIAEAEKEAA